jgi:polyphosphate kinase
MKVKLSKEVQSPYGNITGEMYEVEKARLQVELLNIQQKLIKRGGRLAILFEGRDAAGKGSTIQRFCEYLIPQHTKVIALGIPSPKESKYWFNRYASHLPLPGCITFFDRSWYSRALIEPTMGYCTESQYRYFMKKVLNWEEKLISEGLLLFKYYLSINEETQLVRFESRLTSPLTYWKFSENDLRARAKWTTFTRLKEQMLTHCSSSTSPWIVLNSNDKKEARLTAMLHLVLTLGNGSFEPLTGEPVTDNKSLSFNGVRFTELTPQQLAVLKDLRRQYPSDN